MLRMSGEGLTALQLDSVLNTVLFVPAGILNHALDMYGGTGCYAPELSDVGLRHLVLSTSPVLVLAEAPQQDAGPLAHFRSWQTFPLTHVQERYASLSRAQVFSA